MFQEDFFRQTKDKRTKGNKMTSWKRLFGKKTRKTHRKLESRYEEWLRKLQQDPYAREFPISKKKKA